MNERLLTNDAYARARAGCACAMEACVRAHLPLVGCVCARYPAYGEREDVYQQGCLGLVKAVVRFDGARGTAFSTFAVPHILGEIRAYQKTRDGLGWRARKLARRLREEQSAYFARTGREIPVQTLAQAVGVEAAEIALLLETAKTPAYMDETFADFTDLRCEKRMETFLLRDILARLPPSVRQLLHLRYALGQSQSRVARALGTTQTAVSRREKRACALVRKAWLDAG